MNQQKTGAYLKQLRQEKGLTQAELAEKLGVTNRSVSRWENGVNMPELDLILELADFYQVEISQILTGEKEEQKPHSAEDLFWEVADYSNQDKLLFGKRVNRFLSLGLISLLIYTLMFFLDITGNRLLDFISGLCLGISIGVLIMGVIYTSKYGAKVRAFKQKLLKRTS